MRIDLRRSESLKQGSEIIGSRVRARIVKNKVAAPFRVAEFDIMFNQGISKMGDLLDIGVNRGIVKKAGAYYSYGDTRLGQGRENAKNFLTERSDVAETIEALIRGEEADDIPPDDAAGAVAKSAGGAAQIADAAAVSLN